MRSIDECGPASKQNLLRITDCFGPHSLRVVQRMVEFPMRVLCASTPAFLRPEAAGRSTTRHQRHIGNDKAERTKRLRQTGHDNQRTTKRYDDSGRNTGNKITSRIDRLPVNSITNRSIPTPRPPAGGIACRSARTKS